MTLPRGTPWVSQLALVLRYTKCGSKTRRCHADPPQLQEVRAGHRPVPSGTRKLTHDVRSALPVGLLRGDERDCSGGVLTSASISDIDVRPSTPSASNLVLGAALFDRLRAIPPDRAPALALDTSSRTRMDPTRSEVPSSTA